MANKLLLVLVALSFAAAVAGQQAGESQEISAERIKAAVAYLASDRMEGRGPGTRGEELTTDYLAGEFKKIGSVRFCE